ncbi:MAG: heavy metal translocating P-type ATPase, partial [Dorea sp.]
MKTQDIHEHCSCGCGHHHDSEHQCKHEYTHDHDHDDHDHEGCNCGHHHDHNHDHHHHENNHTHEKHKHIPEGKKKTIFILENLGCANCAAKMERKINELSGVEMAVITYATKQLAVVGEHPEKMLPDFQKICSSIESEVVVIPKDEVEEKIKEAYETEGEKKKDIIAIIIGAVLFISGQLLSNMVPDSVINTIVFVVAYLILGAEIVLTAFKNLTKGHVFDENFLMSVATLAAFAIGDYAEAVGVMLFYRIGELFEEIAVSRSRSQIMEA